MSGLVKKIWEDGRLLVGGVIQGANDLFNMTGLNNFLSRVAATTQSIIGHTTPTNLSVLHDNTVIKAPESQDLSKSPTASQFLNAANACYTVSGTPEGMKPFLVDGKQLAVTDLGSAMSAKVWLTDKNQVIVAFQGTTGGDNIVLNPLVALTGVASDVQVWNQTVSQAQKDALSFTHYVVDVAQKSGIDTDNIFLTGHSLGGIEASYVGQQTGLGGMSFESTGIPDAAARVGDGKNFVSVVTHGDPVGNYASDTEKDSPFVTAMEPGADNAFNHYGKVVMVGAPEDSVKLKAKLDDWNASSFKNIVSLIDVVPDFIKFHLPGTQAADMGIKLSPHSILADAIFTAHGPVLPIGDNNLSQIIAPSTHQNSVFAA
ncbi:lipase [Asaia sp. HN010]|uniref:lipase n=1 Tax=Asaia sp. HN010 TaxID=3081233 RepID=UPI003017583F